MEEAGETASSTWDHGRALSTENEAGALRGQLAEDRHALEEDETHVFRQDRPGRYNQHAFRDFGAMLPWPEQQASSGSSGPPLGGTTQGSLDSSYRFHLIGVHSNFALCFTGENRGISPYNGVGLEMIRIIARRRGFQLLYSFRTKWQSRNVLDLPGSVVWSEGEEFANQI